MQVVAYPLMRTESESCEATNEKGGGRTMESRKLIEEHNYRGMILQIYEKGYVHGQKLE